MIIPIRCFSCGKEIANLWEQYLDLITQYEKKRRISKNPRLAAPRGEFKPCITPYVYHTTAPRDLGRFAWLHGDSDIFRYCCRRAWTELGVTRYCCKRMMLTHVDMIQKLLSIKPSGILGRGGEMR
ncbi:hypothetical protein LTR36_000525 [Oleoguttula mirabilis]|uniref:DNA-directed RNA polymerases I, II, and III subunit RPABC5 n=1 Tax=Oleoguttula mirabilis TaxID=1507867 RepID=A0AAV9JQ71_9PEZI|nr:hypothetical protein LTR36_000525 [Oleoguttula mirabilis]